MHCIIDYLIKYYKYSYKNIGKSIEYMEKDKMIKYKIFELYLLS